MFLNLLAHPDEGDIDRILDTLVARRVDGIIWAVPEVGGNRMWINPDRLDRLPPIIFLSVAEQTGLATVAVDNRVGARQAVQHLIDNRRRRIGLITGPLAWWEARERFAGWQDTVRGAGLDASSSLVVEGDWSASSGARPCALGSLSPVWTRFGVHAMDTSDPAAPKVVHAFLSRGTKGVTIKETWDVMGMRATRSDDTILDGAFVPDKYVARVVAPGAAGVDAFILGFSPGP